MATRLQRRRNTTGALDLFVGAEAETVIDTTKRTYRVCDGETPGGAPASEDVVVDSIKSLAQLPSGFLRKDRVYSVFSFWDGWAVFLDKPKGGGDFGYDPTRPKTDHDGGTVIDPDRIALLGSSGDLDPFGQYFEAAASGTGCFVRLASGEGHCLSWFGAINNYVDSNSRGMECSKPLQALATSTHHLIIDGQNYRVANPVGLRKQSIYASRSIVIEGKDGSIFVDSTEAIFTSIDALADPESTSNLYTAKVTFDNISFWSETGLNSVVINGDRIYNIQIKPGCSFKRLTPIKSFRNKGSAYPTGYIQSFSSIGAHYTGCPYIIDAKRAFNLTFNENMCENNPRGLYIDGDGVPAVNNIRINDNLFEGGGVFVKFGQTLAWSISGNYFEANTIGDISALKCHVQLGSGSSGGVILYNGVQATSAQQSDADWADFRLPNNPFNANVAGPTVKGNWSNSYRFMLPGSAGDFSDNGSNNRATTDRGRPLRPATNAAVDFYAKTQVRQSADHLSAGVFAVASISVAEMKELTSAGDADRDCSGTLNLTMESLTSGGIRAAASSAVVHFMIVSSSLGTSGSLAIDDVYAAFNLISFTQIPAGLPIDSSGENRNTPTVFSNPELTVDRTGDTFTIKLSGYSSTSIPNYGGITQMRTHTTINTAGKSQKTAPSSRAIR